MYYYSTALYSVPQFVYALIYKFFYQVNSCVEQVENNVDKEQDSSEREGCGRCAVLQAELCRVKMELGAALHGWRLSKSTLYTTAEKLRVLKQKDDRSQLKRKRCQPDMQPLKKLKSESTQTMAKLSNPEFSEVLLELINRHSIFKTANYSDVLKEFSLNMHFYSAKAYDFLRRSVGNHLPHPRMFHSWTKFIETSPGI